MDKTLTPREQQILKLVARGLSDQCVADMVGLSHHTVTTYLAEIRERRGLSNRVLGARYDLQMERRRAIAERGV